MTHLDLLTSIGDFQQDPTAKFALTPARRNTAPTYNANAGTYEPGSFGEQNANANAGIYALGSFGDQNQRANNPVRAAAPATTQRFRDPASGQGVQANPTPQVVPQNHYDAVGGVGTPNPEQVPPATRTLSQGQPIAPSDQIYDLSGTGGATGPVSHAGDALALSAVLGGYAPQQAATGRGRGRVSPLNAIGDTGQVLEAAQGIEGLTAQSSAEQQLRELERAGALPTATDSPEARANKIGYLSGRVREVAAGQSVRAPGTNAPYTSAGPGTRAAYTDPASGTASVAQLSALAREVTLQANQPRLMSLGKDANGREVQGVYDGNNFSPLRDPKAEKDATQTIEVGGKTYTVGPGNKYFDETGKPVEFRGDKPLDPVTGQMLLGNYQNTVTQIQNHKPKMFESDAAAAARLASLHQKANFQAKQLGFDEPFPEATPATGASAPSKQAAPKSSATPYKHQDVQAELRRRGLIK